jgi:hypothetical protein
MEKSKKPSNPECYTSSSEPFRIYLIYLICYMILEALFRFWLSYIILKIYHGGEIVLVNSRKVYFIFRMFQSQSYFTTGCSAPITSSWRQAPWESLPLFLFSKMNTCGHSPYVTSSLTSGWVCRVQFLLALANAVILRSESLGTHDHILLSQIRDSPNLEGQVPVFISPRNRVTRLYRQALRSLFVASYDSQGYGGGIQPRLCYVCRWIICCMCCLRTHVILNFNLHCHSTGTLSLKSFFSYVSDLFFVEGSWWFALVCGLRCKLSLSLNLICRIWENSFVNIVKVCFLLSV